MYNLSDQEAARIVELGEARAWADYYSCAPSEFAAAYGVSARCIGPTRLSMIPRLDMTFFNRISCLGIEAPAVESDLDQAIHVLESAECTNYMVPLSPAAQPPELPEWLESRGIHRQRNWAKMLRSTEHVPPVRSDLRIERVGAGYAASFTYIALTAFEMPAEIYALLSCHMDRPGWMHYMAFDGEQPVAAAAMFIAGEIAWLGFGCALESHRRRGGQGALFARRIADGLAEGCKWFVTETGEDTPENPNPSYHNMLRAGFQLVYQRPNYVHTGTG